VGGIDERVNRFHTKTDSGNIQLYVNDTNHGYIGGIQNVEPHNFIIPFQSKRKVGGYSEVISYDEVSRVNGTLSNLYAKIDRISNPEFQPAYDEYIKACDEIIGFRVTTSASAGGKKAAYIVRNEEHIPLDVMGEGITNLLGLIVDLCRVQNKLFVIEELENDIHPKALKNLLNLIVEKSKSNQFIISTHSNIVLRHLGAPPKTIIYNIEMEMVDRIPTSKVKLVDTQEKRMEALEDLGYEAFDFNLWNHWIFFEEASAERVVRELLIPWFIPSMNNRVRTFSARTSNEVAVKFDDFNRLFVFLHLQKIYKNKAYVIIDSGIEEGKILKNISDRYVPLGWKGENFIQLSKHDFEEYYPANFSDKVIALLNENNRKEKKALKEALLNDVIKFSQENREMAMDEFSRSATEVIEILKNIEAQIGLAGKVTECK